MAGPYVHCLVSREALKRLYNNTLLNRCRNITNPGVNAPYFPFICLGSVSPDYPYPAVRLEKINAQTDENGWTWGDKFHKENTGSFIDIGIQELRGITDKTSDTYFKKTAWLMGYYSHIITDLVIHAVIYEIVGGCYENHKDQHLYSEMIQDSLLFYDLYSNPPKELVDVKFLGVLRKCQEQSAPFEWIPTEPPKYVLDKDVEIFWDFILSQNYPDFYKSETPQIDEWHDAYGQLMSAGTSFAGRTLAHSLAYQKATSITADDRNNYYLSIPLPPDGTKGKYREDVFNKAVDKVANGLSRLLNALDNTSIYFDLKKDLKEWNMDKGIIGDTDPKFVMWDGEIKDLFNCPGDPPAEKRQ